ncbi:peptide chain release factor subunit 1 [Halobiforma haloterrestris]|uniref:Peptide chain release factor subunit 1 n=1 Tax=Natronobacterium haloterrestre TaxID=148448 RepID=A0A1I1EGI1_NATHA|nr:Vms1/Ankzf1 family peptidyl-tRNA hydrolase [Halobiforma haloterrestris]SFB85712.1 peptide chain release factor subunit 1 [Halobiforma haloterrestris]
MSHPDYELHERLERLSNTSADRDVLVTLAVPPNESIGEVRRPVETDYAEATQLDERTFPEPLADALESVRSLLSEYEEIPETGLAVYAGVVDGDLVTATFDDLPVPIDDHTYAHATEFDLEPIEGIRPPDRTHGLLVVERSGAALGRLDDGVEAVESFDSDVPGKSSAGGQSAERFERDRERRKRAFFDEVAERAALEFLEGDPVDGVLLGGTTGTVERFREEADLAPGLEERLLGEFAVEYATEQGLRELAEKGESALEERDRREARDALDSFFDGVGGDEPVAYGGEEVDEALEYDAVETLLLSTALEGDRIQRFGDRTTEQGGSAVVVPDDFPAGNRFVEAFDGIGALLRFPIE